MVLATLQISFTSLHPQLTLTMWEIVVLDFNGTDLNISATEPEVQDDIKVILSVIAVDGGAEMRVRSAVWINYSQ